MTQWKHANDDWRLREYQTPGKPARWIFRKNLAPAVPAGDDRYSFVAYLTAAYEPRDETGLPSQTDEDLLATIEEVDGRLLESDGLAIHVGAVLKDGIKDLIFYTGDPKTFLKRAEAIRAAHPEFRWGCDVHRDPAWSQWADLP